jgi:peptidoglycan/LPS O-acetylase OafA/YrhL
MKIFLFVLSGFIGLSAILSGMLMVLHPDGSLINLSIALLEGTPFKDFQVPGLLLAFLVGGINCMALLYHIQKHPKRFNWAIAGGIIVCLWIIVQMMLIHSVYWLHFVYLAAGILVILTGLHLKGKELI